MKDYKKRIPPLILKCIAGQISDEEMRQLNEWARENEANKKLLERLTDNNYLLREIQRRKAINTTRPLSDMKARIEREYGNRKSVRKNYNKKFRTVMTSAAMILIIIGVISYVFRGGRNYHENNDNNIIKTENVSHGTTQAILTLENGKSIALGADSTSNVIAMAKAEEENDDGDAMMMNLTTPRGGEFKVTLEDGTEVWLNAQSQLRYPDTFEGNERKVQLEGEAYFKVAKNTEKPFIVECAGQIVRVTGTEFNINSYNEDPNVYTTLVSGGIALKPMKGCSGELILRPGHQAVFDKTDEHAKVRTVDTTVVTSWRSGSFVFENQTLEQIMTTLSRWYDFSYEFNDASLKKIVFMGSVPRYGEFTDVLRILEMSGNIKFILNGKKLEIEASA